MQDARQDIAIFPAPAITSIVKDPLHASFQQFGERYDECCKVCEILDWVLPFNGNSSQIYMHVAKGHSRERT